MVFVCGIFKDGILYAIDNKFYKRVANAKRRCKQLNKNEGTQKWIVMYQYRWIPCED